MLPVFFVALATAALAAPVIAAIARRFNLVDHPDGGRKQHHSSIPLTGGPTLLLTVLTAIGYAFFTSPELLSTSSGDRRFFGWLAAASLTLCCVGLLDDRFGLRGRQKLLMQLMVTLLMLPSGILIERIDVFGFPIDFGDLAAVFTVLWLLGAINSLNLIDGADGVASTVGLFMSLSCAGIAWTLDMRPDGILVSLALAGFFVGFLFHNLPPARMFLGDSGSMLAGLMLGSVAIKCSMKESSAMALIMPLVVWTIPIFDSSMAIVRRKLTGRSIYATDRNHLHHCLLRDSRNGVRVLLYVAGLCLVTSGTAILGAQMGSDAIAILGGIIAVSLLVASGSFGFVEAKLILRRVKRFLQSIGRISPAEKPKFSEQFVLQGKYDWDAIYARLETLAINLELHRLELLISIPSANEVWHGETRLRNHDGNADPHILTLPLLVSGIQAGTIRIEASAVENPCLTKFLGDLQRDLRDFEQEITPIIEKMIRESTLRNGQIQPSVAPVLTNQTL